MFEYEKNYTIDLSSFEEKVQAQLAEIRSQNNEVNKQLSRFLKKDKDQVKSILIKVFESRKYLDNKTGFNRKYSMIFDYKPEEDLVIISRELPNITDLPTYSELKWNDNKNLIEKIEWDNKELLKFHEDVISQISLITIRDVFCSIPSVIINKVFFIGYFRNNNNTIDRKSDKNLSIYVTRDYFMNIDLLHCDYSACISDLQSKKRPDFIEIIDNQTLETINCRDKRSARKKKTQGSYVNESKVSNSPLSNQVKDLKIEKKPRKSTQNVYHESTTKSHVHSKSIQDSESRIGKKTKKKISEDSSEILTNSIDFQDKIRESSHEIIEHPKTRSIANKKNKSEKIAVEQKSREVINDTTSSEQSKDKINNNRIYSTLLNSSQSKVDINYTSINRMSKKKIKPNFNLDFDD
jgi:hypothetical protein